MKNIKLLKPQPSPKNSRQPLANITNCFYSRPNTQKQTHRSPSSSSRIGHFDSKRLAAPKVSPEARYMQMPTRCINHREKQGKFKAEGDSSSHYCQSCAVELSQKGKRLVALKAENPSLKMVGEAKQYLKSLDEVLEKISQKRSEVRVEKYKLDGRYSSMQEDIEQERRNIIAKINDQYDSEIHKLNETRSRQTARLDEEEDKLKKIEADFNTIHEDVSENLNEINIHIDLAEFREIMNIYWEKMSKVNEKLSKEPVQTIVDSTQAFVSKYVPTDQPYKMTFEENIKKLKQNTPTARQFTFSKNVFAAKCKQAYSWQQSNPDLAESIVQQKIKIK